MERIRESQGLNQVPRPCDYFDLIGSTSTGGIIAIMLRRLQITVDECIQAYDKVGQAAFTPKRRILLLPAEPKGAFSATALKKAIKQVVRENCTDPECTSKQSENPQGETTCTHDDLLFRDETCTKTTEMLVGTNYVIGQGNIRSNATSIRFDVYMITHWIKKTSSCTTSY
ncbi:hypothetical protein F5883DRAFT_525714 [Diaporthe sp. PMI_573]|nr:hypothetical protein F5883DRAFT_525714 [Diaporthaceae sp. PMI_573]